MKRIFGDILRNVLKIGGTALVATAMKKAPEGVDVQSVVGAAITLGGVAWGIVTAKDHDKLEKEANP